MMKFLVLVATVIFTFSPLSKAQSTQSTQSTSDKPNVLRKGFISDKKKFWRVSRRSKRPA